MLQASFSGGMSLLLDDTRLASNQYRVGFNVRNRYDRLDLILSSVEDTRAPRGIKQELTTFGDYQILFVSGKAYYKLYTDPNWIQIVGFSMDPIAPRYWTKEIPISTTNYLRYSSAASVKSSINFLNVSGASQGNMPGLLVQDNINQPQFIFIDASGDVVCRITQDYSQWRIIFEDDDNTKVVTNGDQREYVPIGNAMEYTDGVLYITSQDKTRIYPSVTGRPLDFVRNVTNSLVIIAVDNVYPMGPGGDAETTAYSVGVGGISCLKALSDASLFVAAANANFSVSKNYGNNVQLEFGEYPFIRKFLFNATCLSDRAIFDTTGDTRFIDLTGVRSFNSINQTQNEGRNTLFTAAIQSAFVNSKEAAETTSIRQEASYAAGILYNNYELYALNTIFGPAIAVYDTINSCWSSFDINQTNGKRVKLLSKIELTNVALFAITEDDKVYQLYCGPGTDLAEVRLNSEASIGVDQDTNTQSANPSLEIQLRETRVLLNNITENCTCSVTPYVNNRMSAGGKQTKSIVYEDPTNPTTGPLALADVDTQFMNLYFPTPNCEQGWKVFNVIGWTNGSVTQVSTKSNVITPMNPIDSQTTS